MKNEDDVVKCFICGKLMPGVFESAREKKPAARQPRKVSVVDPTAALDDRMLAMLLDTLLLGVVIAGAVLVENFRWDLIPPPDWFPRREATEQTGARTII